MTLQLYFGLCVTKQSNKHIAHFSKQAQTVWPPPASWTELASGRLSAESHGLGVQKLRVSVTDWLVTSGFHIPSMVLAPQ